MAITKSKNWETRWYGDDHAVLLIDVSTEDFPYLTQITYDTYQHALNQCCQQCEVVSEEVEVRHQNTMYEDDWKNYGTLCPSCQKENDEYWQERWDDLNADIAAGLF